MPRVAKVSTINGYYTYELQDKRFVGVPNDAGSSNFYSATRTGFRSLLSKVDKLLAKTSKTTDADGLAIFVGELKVRFDGTLEKFATSYSAFVNNSGGIDIGCMEFDKAALNKIRKWANAAATSKTTSVAKAA